MNLPAKYRLLRMKGVVLPLLFFELWLSAGTSSAQVALEKLRVLEQEEYGWMVAGVRFISGDRHASKFNEYRDNRVGLYLQDFEVNFNSLFDDRAFFGYQAREAIEKDQAHLLNMGMHGKFNLLLRWDDTPHAFTNTASTIFVNAGNGIFTVPSVLRASLQSNPSNLDAVLEGAQHLNIGLRRAKASVIFTYTPTSAWNIELGYAREKMSGSRPFGTTLSGFTYITELPEPIDYRTRTAKASAEYTAKKWDIRFGYAGSFFDNEVGQLVWDNAFASARGRIDLYPNNTANSLSISGAIDLPASTRFMGSLVRGFMRQNDPFLPFTINSALQNVPELPATSLNGSKDTLAMNYTVNSRAIPWMGLTARYQSYDYDNETPSMVFPGYVSTDTSVSTTRRRNLPYAYDRKTAKFDVVLGSSKPYSLKVGYEWERLDRKHRDVERSVENSVGAAFDYTPLNWLTFRASYRRYGRDPEHYEANFEGLPDDTESEQLEELRKFDQAARNRDRAEVLLILDPTDRLSLSAAWGTTQDDYHESQYGMLHNINYNATFEASYALLPNFVLFGEYTHERYRYDMRSRQRNPPTTPPTDTANNDWESNFRDKIDTYTAGFEGSLFYHRLDYEAFYSLSAANSYIHTAAFGDPTLPGFLPTSTEDYPNPSNRFHQIGASVRFHMAHNLYPKLEYRFERYGREDFQIAPMVPNMSFLDPGTNRSIFLGANVPGYKTHSLAFAMEYRF